MLDFLRSFRTVFLIGRLAVFAVVLVAGSCAALIHRITDGMHFRTVQARVDRLSVSCRTPDGDADCGMLNAMGGGKPGGAVDAHTTVALRYISPADGKEHAAEIDRDGDLSRTLRPGGAMRIDADTADADKIR